MSFREMRRSAQALSEEECIKILQSHNEGVLGVSGDDDYPYVVPLNYGYHDGYIYFHCAKEGHKIDAMKRNDKVSFTVIGENEIHPEVFSTFYKSVIVFGRAEFIEDSSEMIQAMRYINQGAAPHRIEDGDKCMQGSLQRICMIRIRIEHMSGKQSKYLLK